MKDYSGVTGAVLKDGITQASCGIDIQGLRDKGLSLKKGLMDIYQMSSSIITKN